MALRPGRCAAHPGVIPLVSAQPSPADLPASGDPARWPWLQRLRRHPALAVEPWLRAIETGALAPEADLLTALAEQLDAAAELRLLCWWAAQPSPDPCLPDLLGRRRDPQLGAWLLDRLRDGPAALQAGLAAAVAEGLLPLLGAQRQPQAWPALKSWLLAPVPAPLRRAALEGVAVGLPVWPRADLLSCLQRLADDLDPRLAAGAVDLLARLPGCRRLLVPLARRGLDPSVARRLQRRLAATPVQPLLLLVHGRSGGVLPAEFLDFAEELEQRRGAPVRLQALTAASPPEAGPWLRAAPRLTLVPLLLLPGGHVRQDVPAIAAHWRRLTPLLRLPFLGAWPRWQEGLGGEVQALAAAPAAPGSQPLLLHHPLTTPLAGRYLTRLEEVTGGRAHATPYSAEHLAEFQLPPSAPALPLALAANRFTDRLGDRVGPPLLQRPALRQLLLEELEALP